MPILKIDLLDYTLPGTGKADDSDLDEIVQRDGEGLPMIAGKHLKGLLRQAVRCGEQWGWLATKPPTNDWSHYLFGSSVIEDGLTADQSQPGRLHIGNALLSQPVADYLLANPAQIPFLYAPVGANSCNEYGVSKTHSRRRIEVMVPLTLYAKITPIGSGSEPLSDHWFATVQDALPLIMAVGKMRRRGYGRACLSLLTDGASA